MSSTDSFIDFGELLRDENVDRNCRRPYKAAFMLISYLVGGVVVLFSNPIVDRRDENFPAKRRVDAEIPPGRRKRGITVTADGGIVALLFSLSLF